VFALNDAVLPLAGLSRAVASFAIVVDTTEE
jgi:hypothetical protein